MSKRQREALIIFMNELRVGELISEATGQLIFTYDDSWLVSDQARPISLSMPLTEAPYKGLLVENYFDNLLPDSQLIRDRIQARFKVPSKRPFDFLARIGRDCIGALRLLNDAAPPKVRAVTATPMNDVEIATLLKHYKTAPLGMDPRFDFRISIAGAQEKTALLWYKNQWHLPQGSTPTSHIVKLPIGRIEHSGMDLSESVENEWICLQILAAFNLPVNKADIVHFDDMKALVVERFDRRWADDRQWLMRLPQEDFCQALGVSPGLKYESDGGPGIVAIMNLLRGSSVANEDRARFMKTAFLYWIMGAIDGHAKNFSIMLGRQGQYHLAPLYDVLSIYPLTDKKQVHRANIRMAMSLKGKNKHYEWDRMQLRHWESTAKLAQFSENDMQLIIDDVCQQLDAVINKVSLALPAHFPEALATSIFKGMRECRDRCIKR